LWDQISERPIAEEMDFDRNPSAALQARGR
jgi:hypothetical protein